MVLKRIMPCLLYNGSSLIKTRQFNSLNYVGDPINAIKIYNEKEVDEIIILDITSSKEKREIDFVKIGKIASECFMPFTYGGGVKSIDDFKKLYSKGVEKVAINSILFTNPGIVKEAVKMFGSQAVVAVVDFKVNSKNEISIHQHQGHKTNFNINDYLIYLEDEIKVGEILLQDASREGTWSGFNHEAIKKLLTGRKVPVIVCGGANTNQDITKMLYETGADAVALGAMAVYQKKDMGVLIRFPKRNDILNEE